MQSLPNNINAEVEILATILAENKRITEIIESIDPEDFYITAHRIIYESMTKLFMENKGIDIVSLSYELGQEMLKEIGGVTYLSQILNSGLGSADIKSYCRIVKDKSRRRNLIKAAGEIAKKAYDDSCDVDELIDKVQNVLTDNVNNKSFVSDMDLMVRTLQEIEKRYRDGGRIPGISTGLESLDDATNGLKKGELDVIAGRPSMGKTATALTLADNMIALGMKVGLFEMEMEEEAIGMRRLSSLTLIDGNRLQKGQITDDEWERVAMETQRVAARNGMFTDTSTGLRVVDIKAKCKLLKHAYGLDAIIIDHLLLIKMPKADRRDLQIGEVTMQLKNLAKELDICVILLCQLSRAIRDRADKRPQLTDLRDSGSIEQDADLVLGLHREEYYNEDTEDKGILEIIILKQRNGRVGTLRFAYIDKYQKITELVKK